MICPRCMSYMLWHTDIRLFDWKKCPNCAYSKKTRNSMLDWTNGNSQVTDHFNVNDCLVLHQWGRLATENDGADFNKLIILCQKLEQIRAFLGCPMNVHSMYRSPTYNLQIGAPEHDVHSLSEAVDFDCLPVLSIDETIQKLLPKLEEFGIRMERNTTTWVHIDLHPVGNARYFYP